MIDEKNLNQEPIKATQIEETKKEINNLIKEAQVREFTFNGNFSRE